MRSTENKVIIENETTQIEFDGRKMIVVVGGVKRAWLLSDGTWQKPWAGQIPTAKIPAEVVGLTSQATAIVKAAYASKKAEMFPNFEGLEYHQKLCVKYDVLEALGYMSTEEAKMERSGIHASHGVVMSQVEAEEFDNR